MNPVLVFGFVFILLVFNLLDLAGGLGEHVRSIVPYSMEWRLCSKMEDIGGMDSEEARASRSMAINPMACEYVWGIEIHGVWSWAAAP